MRNSRIQFNSIYEDPLEDRHSLAATRAADSSVKEKNKKKGKRNNQGGSRRGIIPGLSPPRLRSLAIIIDPFVY